MPVSAKVVLAKAAGYLGIVTGVLTIVTAIISIIRVGSLDLSFTSPGNDNPTSNNSVIRNINSAFSVEPAVLCVHWLPVLIGFACLFVHDSDSRKLRSVLGSPAFYTIWFLFVGLFANIGYAGWMGIITAIFAFLTALLALLTAFFDYSLSPCLEFGMRRKLRSSLKYGANTE